MSCAPARFHQRGRQFPNSDGVATYRKTRCEVIGVYCNKPPIKFTIQYDLLIRRTGRRSWTSGRIKLRCGGDKNRSLSSWTWLEIKDQRWSEMFLSLPQGVRTQFDENVFALSTVKVIFLWEFLCWQRGAHVIFKTPRQTVCTVYVWIRQLNIFFFMSIESLKKMTQHNWSAPCGVVKTRRGEMCILKSSLVK